MRLGGWRVKQAGTSTLELVLVLPALLFVLFGIVELSRAWFTLNLVTTAAREGARVGTVTPTQSGDVFNRAPAEARIDQILSAANLTSASRSVSCSTPCRPDSQVVADVTVTFQTVVPNLLPASLRDVPLRQTATMRYE
jgi:Flp pilus assembly protein TadG